MKNGLIILSVFFLAIALLDGGNNIIIDSGVAHNIITDETNTDSELPDNVLSSLWDDLRWFDEEEERTEITFQPDLVILSFSSLKTIDFSGFIWQPPKFL